VRASLSILPFALVALFALGQVAWWTTVLTRDAGRLETAAHHLAAGDASGAVIALGAEDAAGLREVAASRRTMFLAEGIAFLVATMIGAGLFWAAVRRERRTAQDHDRFLAAATHELKTPLATLRLGLQSLENQGAPPADDRGRERKYLRDMLGELARLEGGVTNILTAAGLRATPRAVRLVPGDLAQDVRAAVREVQPRAVAAGVKLIDDDVQSCEGTRDPEALRIITHNLLDNAVKHSSPDTEVSVRLTREAGQAVMTVRDAGAGFAADRTEHLFEPFRQGDDHPRGGIGLGLHLVRELTRAHGGSVTAHSEGVGRGAEFTVRLPVEDPS